MKPIIPHKYNIGFVVHNCNLETLSILEPWCDTLYIDDELGILKASYCELEQKHTKIDLKNKLKAIKHTTPDNDIVVEFDSKQLNQESFNIISQLSEIISQSGEIGEFELGIFKISIYAMTSYEHNLIHIYNK
jgi:hypothetical protein